MYNFSIASYKQPWNVHNSMVMCLRQPVLHINTDPDSGIVVVLLCISPCLDNVRSCFCSCMHLYPVT